MALERQQDVGRSAQYFKSQLTAEEKAKARAYQKGLDELREHMEEQPGIFDPGEVYGPDSKHKVTGEGAYDRVIQAERDAYDLRYEFAEEDRRSVSSSGSEEPVGFSPPGTPRNRGGPPRLFDDRSRVRVAAENTINSLYDRAAAAWNASGEGLRNLNGDYMRRRMTATFGDSGARAFMAGIVKKAINYAKNNHGVTVAAIGTTLFSMYVNNQLKQEDQRLSDRISAIEEKAAQEGKSIKYKEDGTPYYVKSRVWGFQWDEPDEKNTLGRAVRNIFKTTESFLDPAGLQDLSAEQEDAGTGTLGLTGFQRLFDSKDKPEQVSKNAEGAFEGVNLEGALGELDLYLGRLQPDLDQGPRAPGYEAVGRFSSARTAGFGRLPYGRSDPTTFKSSSPYPQLSMSPEEFRARYESIHHKTIEGDNINERPNDPKALIRRTEIGIDTKVYNADPSHPGGAYPPGLDTKSLLTYGLEKEPLSTTSDDNSQLWQRSDNSIETRMAESMAPLTYDTTHNPALPSSTDTFTGYQKRAYQPSEVIDGGSLKFAPELVGIGYDEATFAQRASVPSDVGLPNGETPIANASKERNYEVQTGLHYGAPKRSRDELNAANQLYNSGMPRDVKSQKIQSTSTVPANIGASNPK